MPTSKTKELAKKLGLLKKRKNESSAGNARKRRKGQLLSYVVVIDFESTCWKEKRGAQEIIEFPAVLLDIQTGDVVAEFQQYVQPQENPVLSDFCKELTGIIQAQVDSGVPLRTCLYLFGKWVRQMREEKGVCLMEPGQQYSHDMHLCALATWSDWDLGVCLQYECRRKQIRKPLYFDQWIDLRIVYKQFYDRKPSGLCGSLEDLGIPFTGREHCGLDDARNTAKLCYRLVKDGCKLSITKCLQRKKPAAVVKPPETLGENSTDRANSTTQDATSSHSQATTVPSVTCSSGTAHEERGKSGLGAKTREDDRKINGKDVEPQTKDCGRKGVVSAVEGEDWADGSDDQFLNEVIHELEKFEKESLPPETGHHASTFQDPRCSLGNLYASADHANLTKPTLNAITPSRACLVSHIAPVTLLPPSRPSMRKSGKQPHQESNTHSPLQQQTTSPLQQQTTSPLQQQTISTPVCSAKTTSSRTPTAIAGSSQTITGARSELLAGTPSFAKPSDSFRTPSTTQWMKQKNYLSTSPSLSTCDTPQPFNGGKLTPPLCTCGKRAKRKLVTSPGPNQGKPFFSCPRGRESGCQYFRWESAPSPGSTSAVNLSSEYT